MTDAAKASEVESSRRRMTFIVTGPILKIFFVTLQYNILIKK